MLSETSNGGTLADMCFLSDQPEGITVLRSQFDNNVTISYKEVSHRC